MNVWDVSAGTIWMPKENVRSHLLSFLSAKLLWIGHVTYAKKDMILMEREDVDNLILYA